MNPRAMKELVEILMESPFYFELFLRERYDLIRRIGEISPYYGNGN
jgi:hypothetical protein